MWYLGKIFSILELLAGFELLSQALGSRKDGGGRVMMAVVLADSANN